MFPFSLRFKTSYQFFSRNQNFKKVLCLLIQDAIGADLEVITIESKRAYLKYIGNRQWIKLRKPNISLGKHYLIYIGNRRWKKDKHTRVIH